MSHLSPPIPERAPLTRNLKGGDAINYDWLRWLRSVVQLLDRTPKVVGGADLADQGASLAMSPVPIQDLHRGLYRISWYVRVSRAATVSSSITPSIQWTDGGVVCSTSGAALTTNTTGSVQSGSVVVQADEDTTIEYEAAYASVGATSMQYRLVVVVEQLPAVS